MRAFCCLLLVGVGACTTASARTTSTPAPRDSAQADVSRGGTSAPNADPFPSTYVPFPSRTTVIRNVNLLTAAGPLIRNGSILLQNGKIMFRLSVILKNQPPSNRTSKLLISG